MMRWMRRSAWLGTGRDGRRKRGVGKLVARQREEVRIDLSGCCHG